MRTPPLLSPVENENSDLLIIHILGERSWEGLSPFTVLTIGGFTSAGLLTLEAGCTERGASTSRALSELLLFENDNVLDGLALDVLPGLSGSHGFAIG